MDIKKIRSNRKTLDTKFMKKETLALNPTPFGRDVTEKAFEEKGMRESV